MKSVVHIGNDRADLQHSVDYWGKSSSSNRVKSDLWVHSNPKRILREYQNIDMIWENGSVFRCCPFPTKLHNIPHLTAEAPGEKWKYFKFKMLLSEKLVRTAGTEHTQKPVLKFQTYSPIEKKRLSKTKKVSNPCIPDTMYVMSSSVEAEPMEIRSTSSISCFWRE